MGRIGGHDFVCTLRPIMIHACVQRGGVGCSVHGRATATAPDPVSSALPSPLSSLRPAQRRLSSPPAAPTPSTISAPPLNISFGMKL